jgi:hypothetical protein
VKAPPRLILLALVVIFVALSEAVARGREPRNRHDLRILVTAGMGEI